MYLYLYSARHLVETSGLASRFTSAAWQANVGSEMNVESSVLVAMFMPTRLKVLVSSESTSGSQIKVGHLGPIADERSGRDDEESQDGRLV